MAALADLLQLMDIASYKVNQSAENSRSFPKLPAVLYIKWVTRAKRA
jgi:hypothetical protein